MSLTSTEEDIDLSMEVEATSSTDEGMSAASTDEGMHTVSTDEDVAPPMEVKFASPVADKSGPYIMLREASPSIHETVADSTEKTSSDEGSPPHTNTTRATTPESEVDRHNRIHEDAKRRSWEAPRPRTPLWRVPLRLHRVSEQSSSSSETD